MNPRLLKKVKVEEPISEAQTNAAEASILSAIDEAKKGVLHHQSELEKYQRRLTYYESQLAALNRFKRSRRESDKAVWNDPESLGSTSVDAGIAQPLKMVRSEKQDSSSKKESPCIGETGEQKDVISLIRSSSSPEGVQFQGSSYLSSKHSRKMRSLIVNPVNDHMFATSALNGVVNLWEVQAEGPQACLLDSIDCLLLKERRWPEDIAWNPSGKSIHAVYSADGGAVQASILNLDLSQEKRVEFLKEKPHSKGNINNVVFMPWEDLCFATGGSDHAVVLWCPKRIENSWKTEVLHQNLHSSAVMGVVGVQGKHMILSTGQDKKIVGFDILAGRGSTICQLESKCMRILPNPCDFNLFMVQTGTHGKQLRLFDYRQMDKEVHAFGWNQESSSLQSALTSQVWSPNGTYITSGSPDPMIHIFDIRFHRGAPSQSLKVHQKRVFKAAWLHSLPLLVSTSSDLQIGLHKIA